MGFLLGVEEEAAAAGTAAPEREGPTEAEVLERYLDSLPRKKPMSTGKRVLLAAALGMLLFLTINYIDNLESRIQSLTNSISNMTHQMSNVQGELYGISDDISTRIDEALKQEYGLLASWEMELTGLDYQQGTAELTLTAVLKHRNENGGGLSFYARLRDGSYVTAPEEAGTFDSITNSYTSRLTLPMDQDEVAYYLTTPEGIVCLAEDGDHALCSLAYGTQLQLYWADFFGGWSGANIEGQFELGFAAPWMWEKGLAGELGEPEVTALLMYNGQPVRALELENRGEQGDMEWLFQGELYVNNDVLGGQLKTGDRVWVAYTAAFESGPALAGESDFTFRYAGTQWVPEQEEY